MRPVAPPAPGEGLASAIWVCFADTVLDETANGNASKYFLLALVGSTVFFQSREQRLAYQLRIYL